MTTYKKVPIWNDLQVVVQNAKGQRGIDDMLGLLELEVATQRRPIFIKRIYGRYSRLRREQEMKYYLPKKKSRKKE